MRLLALLLVASLALAGCNTDDDPGDGTPGDGQDGGTQTTTGPFSQRTDDTRTPGQDTTTSPASTIGGGAGGTETSTGSVYLYVKDAPEDTFAEVHIVVNATMVHLAGAGDEDDDETDGTSTSTSTSTNGTSTSTSTNGTSTSTSTNGTSTSTSTNGTSTGTDGNGTMPGCDAGWVTVSEQTLDIDLLATQGDLAAFLGGIELPTCKITQIRLLTQSAYGVTHEGENTTIRLANDVLRVVRSFTVTADATTHVVIDIDLDRSLREQGPQGWRLTPVIGKAYERVMEAEEPQPGEIVTAPPE